MDDRRVTVGNLFSLDFVGDADDQVFKVGVGLGVLGDLLAGVDHGGVVPSAEGLADLGQGHGGHLTAQVHGHLPGGGDGFGALLAVHLLHGGVEVLGGNFLYIVGVDDVLLGDEQVLSRV